MEEKIIESELFFEDSQEPVLVHCEINKNAKNWQEFYEDFKIIDVLDYGNEKPIEKTLWNEKTQIAHFCTSAFENIFI